MLNVEIRKAGTEQELRGDYRPRFEVQNQCLSVMWKSGKLERAFRTWLAPGGAGRVSVNRGITERPNVPALPSRATTEATGPSDPTFASLHLMIGLRF